jgi:hypothetical protein
LHFGWDNVPMHRWGQSQMFRSLAFYLRETLKTETAETGEDRGQISDIRDQSEPLNLSTLNFSTS